MKLALSSLFLVWQTHGLWQHCRVIREHCACARDTYCHWCPDGECHAYASVFGCLQGQPCGDECKSAADCEGLCRVMHCSSGHCEEAAIAPDGTLCLSFGECQAGQCLSHAFCTEPNQCNGHPCNPQGKCLCGQGWTGERCETGVCLRDCNGHGDCTRVSGIASDPPSCVCHHGWGGPACEDPLPMCAPLTVHHESVGEFSDGSGPESYRPNTHCRWYITPDSDRIDFIEISVQISLRAITDTFVIRDSCMDTGSNKTLLFVQGPFTSSAPLTVRSTHNSCVQAEFTSLAQSFEDLVRPRGGMLDFGFSASFQAGRTDRGSGLSDSCETYLHLDSAEGQLSVGGAQGYEEGLLCEWVITPPPMAPYPNDQPLSLSVVNYHTLTGDNLIIFDGLVDSSPVLVRLTGAAQPQNLVATQTTGVLIRFVTFARPPSTIVSRLGFQISWSLPTYTPPPCTSRSFLESSFGRIGGSAAGADYPKTCSWLLLPPVKSDCWSESVEDTMALTLHFTHVNGVRIVVYDGPTEVFPALATVSRASDTVRSSQAFSVLIIATFTAGSSFTAHYLTSFASRTPTPSPPPAICPHPILLVSPSNFGLSPIPQSSIPPDTQACNWLLGTLPRNPISPRMSPSALLVTIQSRSLRPFTDFIYPFVGHSDMGPTLLPPPGYLSGSSLDAKDLVSPIPVVSVRSVTGPGAAFDASFRALEPRQQCAPFTVVEVSEGAPELTLEGGLHPLLTSDKQIVCEWLFVASKSNCKGGGSPSTSTLSIRLVGSLAGVARVSLVETNFLSPLTGEPYPRPENPELGSLLPIMSNQSLALTGVRLPLLVRLSTTASSAARSHAPAPVVVLTVRADSSTTKSTQEKSMGGPDGISIVLALSTGVLVMIGVFVLLVNRVRSSPLASLDGRD